MTEDITTNEVLNVKLDYIQKDIAIIKTDIKEIKSDYIIRREFNEALVEIRSQLAFFQKIVYSVFTVVGLSVLAAILKLIIK